MEVLIATNLPKFGPEFVPYSNVIVRAVRYYFKMGGIFSIPYKTINVYGGFFYK